MVITFTKPLTRPDSLIRAAAREAGCYARVKHYKQLNDGQSACTFVLCVDYNGNDHASTEHHDRVILALLTLDPNAKVKTARAIYEGFADFEAQMKARVA